MRRGDFSEALNGNGSLQLIYDPLTGDIDGRGRTAFPGNIIPADRINAIALKINEFYPLPNGPGNSSNYFKDYVSTFDRNQYRREDQLESQPRPPALGKDRRDGRDGEQPPEALVRRRWLREDEDVGRGRSARTSSRARSFVIDTTFGYSLLDQYGWGPDYGTNYGLELGVPGTNGPDIRQSGMPVWGNGMSAQGSTDSWNPYTRFDPSYTVSANITKLAGKHTLRLGAAIDRQAMNHWQPEFGGTGPRGRLDFSGNLAGCAAARRRTSTTSTRPSCSASRPRCRRPSNGRT